MTAGRFPPSGAVLQTHGAKRGKKGQKGQKMTPILKVITEYCAGNVNDQILNALAVEDKPLYARRMWGYLLRAIPEFTLPANMPLYLMGTPDEPKLVEPRYGNLYYTTTEEITDSFTLTLDENGKGYELFCCRLVEYDDFDNQILLPTSGVEYDDVAGTVTFTATAENPIPKGTTFDMDFYKDGYFIETLSHEIMRILGICFEIAWQTRFNNDFLSNVSKVEDKSFSEQNRANKENADTARLEEIRTRLAEAMRRYEQNLHYRKAFPTKGLI